MSNVFGRLERCPKLVIAIAVVLTGLFAIPMVTMAPTESASTEPGGAVFDARDAIDERFVSSVYPIFFIVEPDTGNIVSADSLRALHRAGEEVRNEPGLQDSLFSYYDVDADSDVRGLLSIADLTDGALGGTIETAPDDAVEETASSIIDRLGPDSTVLNLSTESTRGDDGRWTVPAISLVTVFDNQVLGLGNQSTNLGGGTEAEEFNRSVQTVLRSVEGLDVYGVAIDVNLTSQEQGALAGPFIGFTILAVLVIVGATFRSYWVLATVGAALGALIIWLKGITNLLGFDDDLVLSLIVPIAMISFGVDFAFHAIGRYREERAEGRPPRVAFVTGLTAVSGALILALTSDTVAFLANITAGIESIVNFGLGAGIALGAAFLLLGVVSPLVVSLIESGVNAPAVGRRHTVARIAGSFGAASLIMASVLLMVFVLPWAGVVLLAASVVVTLIVPYLVRSRRSELTVARPTESEDRFAGPVGRAIATVAGRPRIVLPVALGITAVMAGFALRVPTEFDVEDFFSSDSDFVVGLDLLDQHVGERGGEPAQIYVEADLIDPAAVAAIRAATDHVAALDSEVLARTSEGVTIEGGVISVIDAVWESPVAQAMIEAETGIELTDVDGDLVPDAPAQLEALYAVTSRTGVPLDAERLLVGPDDVRTSISLEGDSDASVFSMGLVNSRSQTSIEEAAAELAPIIDTLRSDLGQDSTVQLTGSPFVRQASLNATSRALGVSLPIAVILCLVVASVFLRSLRYGVASVLPILMTVAWLYGFMELTGYAINIVTATIAAVSIGIGIDFAIHFIARYREELERTGARHEAVRTAGEGAGTALVASAVSSAVGFGILAFAPMPLFAAYGFLTAVMIVMALVATLAVLPSVLVLVTSDRTVAAEEPEVARAA